MYGETDLDRTIEHLTETLRLARLISNTRFEEHPKGRAPNCMAIALRAGVEPGSGRCRWGGAGPDRGGSAHQGQEHRVDDQDVVRHGGVGHQDLVAPQVERQGLDAFGEALGGDLAAGGRLPAGAVPLCLLLPGRQSDRSDRSDR